MELASCHHSGALNFEVPSKLRENLCTPELGPHGGILFWVVISLYQTTLRHTP